MIIAAIQLGIGKHAIGPQAAGAAITALAPIQQLGALGLDLSTREVEHIQRGVTVGQGIGQGRQLPFGTDLGLDA